MSIKMTIPQAVWDKLKAGEELTRDDMNSVTHETVCSVCGEAVDTSKEVGDNDASEEKLLAAEVIGHGTGSLEIGCCGVRHYHAKCYWKEMEEIDAAEGAGPLSQRLT